jgi:hypothetical protein
LRTLREAGFRLESAETAARETFDLSITELNKQADNRESNFLVTKTKEQNNEKGEKGEAERAAITNSIEKNASFWTDFKSGIRNLVTTSAAAATPESKPQLVGLTGKNATAAGETEDSIKGMQPSFEKAIRDFNTWEQARRDLSANKEEYNRVMMDVASDPEPSTTQGGTTPQSN